MLALLFVHLSVCLSCFQSGCAAFCAILHFFHSWLYPGMTSTCHVFLHSVKPASLDLPLCHLPRGPSREAAVTPIDCSVLWIWCFSVFKMTTWPQMAHMWGTRLGKWWHLMFLSYAGLVMMKPSHRLLVDLCTNYSYYYNNTFNDLPAFEVVMIHSWSDSSLCWNKSQSLTLLL